MKKKIIISPLHNLLIDFMPPIKQRVLSSVKKCFADLTPNGSINSYAYTQAIHSGYLKINDELNNIIQLLGKVITTNDDIETLRADLQPFIDELFLIVHSASKEMVREDSVMAKILPKPNEEKVKESKAYLEVMLNTELLHIKKEHSSKMWDVFKLILSAVLGAALALLVQSIIN